MHGTSFDFTTWLNGDIHEFIPACRKELIVNKKDVFKKYAIGWCYGEEVICRPKLEKIAVMFLKNDIYFWFHMNIDEFNIIFKEKIK